MSTTEHMNQIEMKRIQNRFTEPRSKFTLAELVDQALDWDEDTTLERLKHENSQLCRTIVVTYFREAIDELGEAMLRHQAGIYDAHQAGDHAEAGNLQWHCMVEHVRAHVDGLLAMKRLARQIRRCEGREDDRFEGYEEY